MFRVDYYSLINPTNNTDDKKGEYNCRIKSIPIEYNNDLQKFKLSV